MAGPPQRRPGDGNDFDSRRPDPNAGFLGEQSLLRGGGSLALSLYRLVRGLLGRRGGGHHRQ